MRTKRLRIAGTCVGILLLGISAMDALAEDLRQPAAVTQTAFDFDNYSYFAPQNGPSASPSDRPVPAPALQAPAVQAQTPSPVAVPGVCCECEGGCASRWCQGGQLGDPWTLPQPCVLQNLGINVGGWAQAGAFTNAHGTESNGPLGTNNLTGFNLHQLYMFAERKTNTDDGGWDLGGRVDYLFGVDGPDTQAFGDHGWDFGWNSSHDYGSAIPQLYAELAYGNWSVKGGHFYCPCGYESIPAVNNFFYSHSYTFYYGEPFTVTGFTATYKFSDDLSAFGGWVDGWDSGWGNLNRQDQFLGGVRWNISEKASIAWTLLAGKFGLSVLQPFDVNPIGDQFLSSLVFTYKITDKWTYVFQNDIAFVSDVDILAAAGFESHAEWYGINQYLFYKLSDCWSFGGRFEWFRDEDGVRVPPFPTPLPLLGNAGNYYEATVGFNYRPHANFVVRPEIRWDWFDGVTPVGVHPFNNGHSNSQFSGGLDMIVTF